MTRWHDNIPEAVLGVGFVTLVVGTVVGICEQAHTVGGALAGSGGALIGYGFLLMLVYIFTD